MLKLLDDAAAAVDESGGSMIDLDELCRVESTFSTVRLRTRVTRGAGSRKAALAMAYKLLDAAQDRWHRIRGAELVPLVRAGATFIDGKLQERRTANESTDDTDTGSVAA